MKQGSGLEKISFGKVTGSYSDNVQDSLEVEVSLWKGGSGRLGSSSAGGGGSSSPSRSPFFLLLATDDDDDDVELSLAKTTVPFSVEWMYVSE